MDNQFSSMVKRGSTYNNVVLTFTIAIGTFRLEYNYSCTRLNKSITFHLFPGVQAGALFLTRQQRGRG